MILNTEITQPYACLIDPVEDLYSSLYRGEFLIFYQPIFDILSHGHLPCVAAEALLRLRNKEGVIVPAYRFIDRVRLFRDIRLALSRFVLLQVLNDLKKIDKPGFHIHVNFFPEDLTTDVFLDWVLNTIASFDERNIIIEVTEFTNSNGICLSDSLFKIKKAGIKVALDDWGQAESNLSRLFLHPNQMKIDRFFVPSHDNPDSLKGCIICQFAASLFNVETALEGIETETQLKIAQAMGINYGQGFFWSKAVPIESLIRNWI